MKQISYIIKNEEGSVLVVALLVLVAMTVIGIAAISTSSLDTRIAGNEKFHKIAFYAAEGARDFVEANTGLWGSANTTLNSGITFPQQQLALGQSFSGTVTYRGEGIAGGRPLRGTGDSADTTTVQRYEMDITGNGPDNAACRLNVGFYRRSPGA